MNKGFTLVELIAVVTILGLIAIITTPAYDSISTNVKSRNYNSKMNTIKAQTLSYVEKYMKDKVYEGQIEKDSDPETNYYCFTVEYLIQNGIIKSDSEQDEYIENNITGEKYSGNKEYIKVFYDNETFKLNAVVIDEDNYKNNDCSHCDNKVGGCS